MLEARDIELLRLGRHADPFGVLGPHRADDGSRWIRAFVPGATRLRALTPGGRSLGVFDSRHPDGVFERQVARGGPYRLEATWADASVSLFDDPYRFGPVLGEMDAWLLGEGSHLRPFEILGATPRTMDGVWGTSFAVWAPNAARVSVVGDFNQWDGRRHPMRLRRECGVWEIFLPAVEIGARYKFELLSAAGELLPLKADPCARQAELRPATASIVAKMPPRSEPSAERAAANALDAPMSVYEVHLGSWRRKPEDGERWLNWDELADTLVPYAQELGFTHLELLPISEHPFDGSWGYQTLGLYAPTARFGDPAGLHRFIDRAHAAGLGVLLDWVPAHFPSDAHGLAEFDGTHLYEYADPREGFHNDWNTLIYNFGRTEVRNFLIGNALYWLERYDADGLRVDAVASMLYRDYSRKAGEWIPNAQGGRENLEAIAFLRRTNEVVGGERPGAVTLAEESTAFPGVSRPTWAGGLGFHYKWNMGWMHDTLAYMARDPIHRPWHHGELSFGLVYAFTENFVLPLSHDEVVHGKGSLLAKMPGDRWQKFANLRAYFGFMFGHPGKKLLFMGGEFAQAARVEPRRQPGLAPARAARACRRAAPRRRPEPPVPRQPGAVHAGLRRRRLRVDRPPGRAALPAQLRAPRARRRAHAGGLQFRARRAPWTAPGRARGRRLARTAEHRFNLLRRQQRRHRVRRRAQRAGGQPRPRAVDRRQRAALGHRVLRMDRLSTPGPDHPGPPPGSSKVAAPHLVDGAGLQPGRAWPLGAHWDGTGVNFAVFSGHATHVELCLFDAAGTGPTARIALPARSGDVWHGFLPDAAPGLVYGFRAHGPWRPDRGHRFNPNKLLLDPWAREIVGPSGGFDWSAPHGAADREHPQHMDPRDNARSALKARVVHDAFDWQDDRPPQTALADTVLYELHVRGFTQRMPGVPAAERGTYAGLASDAAISHLQRLGISAVSLLPVHQFIDEQRLVENGLRNYWGYNTVGFFCPEPRYAAGPNPRDEFRRMVRRLHRAGIEVILDVVYNHTAESDERGPTIAWRGLDNLAWYRLQPGHCAGYDNITGTGNALDLHHPRVLQMVMDSLRYWVQEMHVDGFRFDLAPVLGRGSHGFERDGAFFKALAQDPALAGVKLIAEPWDLGPGGYQMGNFPNGWLEWNDVFRDTVRAFWLGGDCTRGEFALRLAGSADRFQPRGRAPAESVNYVVSHDGFSLADLVSYDMRHNEANLEGNRDGHGHNLSWNCGWEGPTDDPEVLGLRERLQRALLATVLLSQGTPMIAAGGELGHGQGGNNNPYCQDNETSWIDWSRADPTLIDFTARLLALRRRLLPFGAHWYSGLPDARGRHDLTWLRLTGEPLTTDEWNNRRSRVVGALINAPGRAAGPLLLLVNARDVDVAFKLPRGAWQAELDTAEADGRGRWKNEGSADYPLRARSLVLLSDTPSAPA